MPKCLLFAVGGTGGHLYPAIGTAQELQKKDPSLSITFAGGGLKNNLFFKGYPFNYHEVSSGNRLLDVYPLIKGVFQGFKLLKAYKPSAVIGFGSYYSLPLLIAAKLKGIPIILLAQDSIPGRVIRFSSSFAASTGTVFPNAKKYLRGNTAPIKMPLREKYRSGTVSREEAIRYFSLKANLSVVLIFGGSQGALGLNRLVYEATKAHPPFQILHFTGHASETDKHRSHYETLGIPHTVKDFEDRMDLAWSVADAAISRAGAMSIAEQLEFEVPGILIPYPYGTDNHQETNADFLVEVGGAVKLREQETSGAELYEVLIRMLEERDKHAASMRSAKKHLAQLDFSDLILNSIR